MYDTAKKSRAANKAKAERLANRPLERVDSSDWTPPPLLKAEVKTGMRPVSKQALRRGGKVQGGVAKVRADRMARKAGGRVETKGEQPLVDRYINRDLKKANEYRDGEKHEGALKRGGIAKLAKGTKNARAKHKDGGKVHSDAKEDKAMIKSMVKPSALKGRACYGGRMKKADGGPTNKDPRLDIVKPKAMEFGQNTVVPGLKKGGRTAKAFGGPMGMTLPAAAGSGVAPSMPQMPTLPAQAMQNAQGRPFQDGQFMPPGLANRPAMGGQSGDMATQVMPPVASGAPASMPAMPPQAMGAPTMPVLPPQAAAAATNALASARPFARAAGGRTKGKGKTNINIVIAQAPKEQDAMPPMPSAGPQGIPVPLPPAGGAPAGGPMGTPPMPPAPMGAPRPSPFKKGGRVTKVAHSYKDMEAGAGSGEGRLQKTDIAKRAPHKAGGKVYRSYKDMDAGAGSGFGRLEKTEIASKKSRKG